MTIKVRLKLDNFILYLMTEMIRVDKNLLPKVAFLFFFSVYCSQHFPSSARTIFISISIIRNPAASEAEPKPSPFSFAAFLAAAAAAAAEAYR